MNILFTALPVYIAKSIGMLLLTCIVNDIYKSIKKYLVSKLKKKKLSKKRKRNKNTRPRCGNIGGGCSCVRYGTITSLCEKKNLCKERFIKIIF